MFSKIELKRVKSEKKNTQIYTYFSVRWALYIKIFTCIDNFVGRKN